MEIFNISLTEDSRDAILARVEAFLAEARFHRIATVNPEFLVLAEKDLDFKQSLQDADLCVADGVGIVWAGWLQGKKVTRFPGTDLLHEVLVMAERDGHAVYLAIHKDGLSSYEEIRTALLKKYPKLLVSGTDGELGSIGNWKLKIGNSAIVLCNYGAPMQELFLADLKEVSVTSRLAMGIGGAFDFITGKQKRAPEWLRALGLEWLWRLILQPWRFKRIWNAVIVFPFLLLRSWQKEQKKL
ncbi:MAG: WecB/TagA/CpsF family glycosyltransferase [Candidatus Moranbacteria bacterium]|nr:WecB/TagA/CpsF family glycosyltransferase [Candidatus Moranbacteria bacterium]